MKGSTQHTLAALLLVTGGGLGLAVYGEEKRSAVDRELLDRSFEAMEGTRAVQTLWNAMQLNALSNEEARELLDEMIASADTRSEARILEPIRACFSNNPTSEVDRSCVERTVEQAKTRYAEELSRVWTRSSQRQRVGRLLFTAGLGLVVLAVLVLGFMLTGLLRMARARTTLDESRELKSVLRKRLEDLYSVHAKPPDEKSNADRLQTVLGALADAVAERAATLGETSDALLSELRELGGTPEASRPSFLPARSLLDTVQDAFDQKVQVEVRVSAPPVVVADSAVTNVAMLLLTKALGRSGEMVSATMDTIETNSGPMVRLSLRTEGRAPTEALLAERIAERLIHAQGGTLERRFNGADVCLRATRASLAAVDETFAGPWNR